MATRVASSNCGGAARWIGLDARASDQSASSPAAGCNLTLTPPRSKQLEAVRACGGVEEQSAHHLAQHRPRGSRSGEAGVSALQPSTRLLLRATNEYNLPDLTSPEKGGSRRTCTSGAPAGCHDARMGWVMRSLRRFS